MKTTTYNTAKEMSVGIWLVVFTIAIFTTVKVKELKVNENLINEGIRTEIFHSSFPSLPVADAKLIEEPVHEAETTITTNTVSGKEQDLAIQMKSWMNNSAYWSNDAAGNEQELAVEMKSWMKNGTYWEATDNNQQVESLQSVTIENPMNENNNGIGDSGTKEQEVASQMESWMNKGDYWSATN